MEKSSIEGAPVPVVYGTEVLPAGTYMCGADLASTHDISVRSEWSTGDECSWLDVLAAALVLATAAGLWMAVDCLLR